MHPDSDSSEDDLLLQEALMDLYTQVPLPGSIFIRVYLLVSSCSSCSCSSPLLLVQAPLLSHLQPVAEVSDSSLEKVATHAVPQPPVIWLIYNTSMIL